VKPINPAVTLVSILAILLVARALIWSGVRLYRMHECEIAHDGEAVPECPPPARPPLTPPF
jgi:hypothetical protein